MDAALDEAKSSMRHDQNLLAVAEGNVRRVKEENEKLEGEIRKLKEENEKLEILAVTVEKKCKEVWGILESRR
jgi:predicted RNase H-like nuclease (RuvC/YqgF family)